MIDLADLQPIDGLTSNAEHLGTRAERCNVLETPPLLIIEAEAGHRSAVRVELNAFGAGNVVAQPLWERHFHTCDQVDDHSHLFTLSGMRLYETCATCERERKCLAFLRHEISFP
jgi:hypothetical protein